MYIRQQYYSLKKRIDQEPRRLIQVLYGPRQVGKSTLVAQLSRDSKLPFHMAATDGILGDGGTWIRQQWNTARAMTKAEGGLLIIDEIQKISNWSEFVKKEWDQDSLNQINLKVILLGSSRLLLQQGLSESLAGRFETTYMGHWSFAEMQEAFDISLEEYLIHGGYPGTAPFIGDESRWKSYVLDSLIETSVSKDILMLTRINKPALLRQLFTLGAAFSGQILSFTKILGQLQDAGNTTTLAHYLTLLHTAGLLTGLPKFSPNLLRKRGSSPKFQVHNNALMTASISESITDLTSDKRKWGRIVESAVGAYLLNESLIKGDRLLYWREGNHEVDFIYEQAGRILAIEVKSGSGSPGKGFGTFMKQHPDSIPLLIGNEGIPLESFLTSDLDSYF